MSTNETTTFHCPTGISLNGGSTKINVQTAELFCTENGIYLDERQIIQQNSRAYIKCKSAFSQALYESNSSLAGCDVGAAMTLLIGYRLQGMPDVKLLGLCYDLGAQRLRFVSFLAYASRNLLLDAQTDNVNELNQLHLDTYIGSLSKYLRIATPSEFQQLIGHQKRLGELFDGKLFEYASLLQDAQQMRELSGYSDMLSIVWMRALRLGNWQHFLQALRAAASNDDDGLDKFNVRVGVSGVATLPLAHNCNASQPLQLMGSENEGTLTVPAHIWAHVRAVQPTGSAFDEFVVVGHNSPYFNILELSSFCYDICAEIPWLRHTLFDQLHLVPKYGVVQCCSMDQLHKLTDFPLHRLTPPPPPPVEFATTTTPETPLLLL